MTVTLNSQPREVASVPEGAPLTELVGALGLQADRIAIELNGEIAPRASWSERSVRSGDRLEIVHFVGGGAA